MDIVEHFFNYFGYLLKLQAVWEMSIETKISVILFYVQFVKFVAVKNMRWA
jgi:hypothetical protein